MIDILPCPNCNAQADICTGNDICYVICHNCKLKGPSEKPEYFIKCWNDLPRKLQWTKKFPTIDGSYWFLPPDEEPIVLEIEDGKVRDGRLLIDCSILQGKWSSSPIPKPMDVNNG